MSAKDQAIYVLSKMLDGSLDLIEGVRRLIRLRASLPPSDLNLLLPFIGVDSETDDLPVGAERSFWTPDGLAAKDKEKEEYLARTSDMIREACRRLLDDYSERKGGHN